MTSATTDPCHVFCAEGMSADLGYIAPGISFAVPRHSLVSAVDYRIFDDLSSATS